MSFRPLPPHPDDVPFVKGPFDNQKLRIPQGARNQQVAMRVGDKIAVYRPATLRKTFCYVFLRLTEPGMDITIPED